MGRVLGRVAEWKRWMPFLHDLEILQEADGIHRLRVATPRLHQGRPFEVEVIPGRRALRFRELAQGRALAEGLEGRWTWNESDDEADLARVELELSVDRPLLQFRTRVLLERGAELWLDALEAALGGVIEEVEIYRVPLSGKSGGTGGELRMHYRDRVYRLVEETP